MKKFLLIILSMMMLFSAGPVSARTLLLAEAQSGDTVFAAVYDEAGTMVSVQMVTVEPNGKISVEIPDTHTARVYMPKTNTVVKPETVERPTPSPDTPEPSATPQPTETLHPAYENKAAAIYAFMVVTDVTDSLYEDEPAVAIEAYYHGREITVLAEDWFIIDSAPDAHRALEGMPVAELQAGDVIYCRASLDGQLLGIDLLFRPMTTDIVTSHEDFSILYTAAGQVGGRWPMLHFGESPVKKNQYAFGVVEDVFGGRVLALTNQAGQASDTLYLDLQQDTIVYVYDQAVRKKLSIGDISDIIGSSIPRDTRDEDGNIIQWNNEDEHHYAFVRLYNGVATEVVVYNNY